MTERATATQSVVAPPAPAGPWHRPMPMGLPYHLLARNDRNRWWRPLMAGLLIAVLGIMVAFGVAGIFAVIVLRTGTDRETLLSAEKLAEALPVPLLAFKVVSIALLIPIVFLAAWLVQRQRPGSLSSVVGRLRWRWLLTCAGIAVLAVVLGRSAYVMALAASGEQMDLFGWVGWEAFLPALVVIVLLVPFQAAAEEYLFRGWVLQAFGAYIKSPWPAIVLGAAGYTALHAYTDWGVAYVLVLGVAMGWLTVRTGGLEAAIALHVGNNVLVSTVAAAAGQLPQGILQGTRPWQFALAGAVQATIFAALVVWLARRRRVQMLS